MNEHNDHLVSRLHCELSNPTLLPTGAATIQQEGLDFAVAGVQIHNCGMRMPGPALANWHLMKVNIYYMITASTLDCKGGWGRVKDESGASEK